MAERLEMQVVASAKQAQAELMKLQGSIQKVGVTINQSFGEVNQSFSQINNGMSRSASTVQKSSKSMLMSITKLVSAVYLLRRAFRFLGKGIEEAMDYREVTHLFSTVFSRIGHQVGEDFTTAMFERIESFQKSYEFLGFDKKTLMGYQAVFGQMANAMGVVPETAYDISEAFTALGTDMTSLFNLAGNEEAMQKLQAGLAGQIRPLRRLGVDISKTTLMQEARNRGIYKSIEAMTASEKVQLRYIAIMKQLQVAMGDLPKTIQTPSNQFRIFKEQIILLSRAIGSIFIPMLGVLLQVLNGILMAIIPVIEGLARLVGYEKPVPEVVDKDRIAGLGGELDLGIADEMEEAEESSAKIKRNLMGFDEINLLDTSAGGIDAYASFDLGDEITQSVASYNEFRNKIMEEMDYLPRDIQAKLSEAFKNISFNFQPMIESFKGLRDSVKEFIDPVIETLKFFYTDILTPLAGFVFTTGLPGLIDILSLSIEWLAEAIDKGLDVFKEFWNDFLKPIGQWVGDKISDNLKDMKEKLEDLGFTTDNTTEFMDKFQTIVGTALISLGIFGLIALAVKGILLLLTPFIGLLSLAFAVLTSPIALVVLAVGGLIAIGYLLYQNWTKVINWLREEVGVWASSLAFILESVAKIFLGLVAFIGGTVAGDWETAFWGLWEIVGGIFEMIMKLIGEAINWIIKKVNGMIEKVNAVSGFLGFGKALKEIKLIDTTQIKFENRYDSPLERLKKDLKSGEFDIPDLLAGGVGGDKLFPGYSAGDYKNWGSPPSSSSSGIGDDLMNRMSTIMAESQQFILEQGQDSPQEPTMELDGRTFAKLIVPYIEAERTRLGYNER